MTGRPRRHISRPFGPYRRAGIKYGQCRRGRHGRGHVRQQPRLRSTARCPWPTRTRYTIGADFTATTSARRGHGVSGANADRQPQFGCRPVKRHQFRWPDAAGSVRPRQHDGAERQRRLVERSVRDHGPRYGHRGGGDRDLARSAAPTPPASQKRAGSRDRYGRPDSVAHAVAIRSRPFVGNAWTSCRRHADARCPSDGRLSPVAERRRSDRRSCHRCRDDW